MQISQDTSQLRRHFGINLATVLRKKIDKGILHGEEVVCGKSGNLLITYEKSPKRDKKS